MWVPDYRPKRRMDIGPHIVPTIRRAHRFVSYCTTVVVFIPRLHAVVVSLKDYLAHPLLYMSDDKSILLYVLVYQAYDK